MICYAQRAPGRAPAHTRLRVLGLRLDHYYPKMIFNPQNVNKMERTKLVSVRLETETFEKIEEIVERETYYKRSDVINNLLKAVLDNFTPEQIHDMMYRWKWDRNVVNTQFEVTTEIKPFKRK